MTTPKRWLMPLQQMDNWKQKWSKETKKKLETWFEVIQQQILLTKLVTNTHTWRWNVTCYFCGESKGRKKKQKTPEKKADRLLGHNRLYTRRPTFSKVFCLDAADDASSSCGNRGYWHRQTTCTEFDPMRVDVIRYTDIHRHIRADDQININWYRMHCASIASALFSFSTFLFFFFSLW